MLDSNWLASETWNDELVSSAVASTGRTSCLVEPVAGMLKQNLKKSITSRTCRPLARGLRKEASARKPPPSRRRRAPSQGLSDSAVAPRQQRQPLRRAVAVNKLMLTLLYSWWGERMRVSAFAWHGINKSRSNRTKGNVEARVSWSPF